MSKRLKLETAIEKEAFKLVSLIKEHVQDHTILHVRRNNVELDRESMSKTLEIVRSAIESGFQMNVDRFKQNLNKVLEEFTEEENPTQ